MYKNFSPAGLGISGRQSELIELALTYAYRGLEIDIEETHRRAQRSDFDSAARYLNAADVLVGGFDVPVDLDSDDEAFAKQIEEFKPAAEIGGKLGAKCATINVPAGTDRLPYHEYFQVITNRVTQISDILGGHGVRLAVGFSAAADAAEGKEFEFIKNVEGFLPLVKGIGGNVGYLIDTFDWFAGMGGMDQLSEIAVDQIVSVRLSGMSDAAAPGTAKNEDRTMPKLGGTIDYLAIAQRLVDGGYDGPVAAFSAPNPVRGGTRDKVANEAQESLDAIFTDVGLTVAPRPMDLISEIVVDYIES